MECWFGGKTLQANSIYKYQETCVTVTWIKLSQQLLRLTGEPKYADAIETAWYNALLGAMSPDGKHWAQYTPLSGRRMEGEEHCSMGLNCCIASGPRGLFTLPHTVIMQSASGASVNFYADGTYRTSTPLRQKLVLIQKTTYPADGNIMINVDGLSKPENLELRFRVPSWSKSTRIAVNGEPVPNIRAGEYQVITRNWKKGDSVEIVLDMSPRLQKTGSTPEYISLMKGPILFARDTRLGGPELTAILKPVMSKQGGLTVTNWKVEQNDIWMELSAEFLPESYPEGKEKPVAIRLCDYASAGNGSTPSYFLVWMPQLLDARKLTN
ncbi:MAG: hypothetical protein EOP49_29380 [Sphingobacteriales bacterium]|nr:MAG: hypothetical protein EOP49_29380 [Sphingobacteriales bacterium]